MHGNFHYNQIERFRTFIGLKLIDHYNKTINKIYGNLILIKNKINKIFQNPTVKNFQTSFNTNCVQNLLYNNSVGTYRGWRRIWRRNKVNTSVSPERVKGNLEICPAIYLAGYLFKT